MSKKKEAFRRNSVQVEVEVPGSTQSAAARRSAEAELRTLIDKFVPEHLRLIGALRRSLRKRLPTAHEVVYEYRDWFVISYSPNERGYEGVLAIRGSADAVQSRSKSRSPARRRKSGAPSPLGRVFRPGSCRRSSRSATESRLR